MYGIELTNNQVPRMGLEPIRPQGSQDFKVFDFWSHLVLNSLKYTLKPFLLS